MLAPTEHLTTSLGEQHRTWLTIQERELMGAFKSLAGTAGIKSISTKNLMQLPLFRSGDTFTLYIEFCPLYASSDRPFSEYANLIKQETFTYQDILNSCIGSKWLATQAVIMALAQHLSRQSIRLSVRATFWDMGVILSTREFASTEVLHKHAAVYRTCLEDFCNQLGIACSFNSISDYSQDHLPEICRVPQYIVVDEGCILNELPSESEILKLLGLESRISLNSRAGRRAAKLFLKRLAMSDNNLGVAAGYIHTYVSLTPLVTAAADARLGMEVVDIFLALASADPSSRQCKMPAINVLVE